MAEESPARTAVSPRRPADRGVSEVLSYALVFAMIVSAIGIVTVGGMGSLQDARTNEQAANAERAYDVLADNLADVHAEGAPSRATEISLGNSELFFATNVTMEVRVTDTAAGVARTHAYELRPIVFRIGDGKRLVYEAGAVIRDERQGGIVLSDPPLAVSPTGTHVPIVRTTADNVQSVGSANVLVRGESTNRTVLESSTEGDYEVDYVQLTTPRAAAWEGYFEDEDYCASVTEPAAGTVRCVFGGSFDSPDRFYLTLQQVEVELIN